MIRCKNCLQEIKANTEACGNCGALVHPPPVAYFYTPPIRLLVLSCITMGLYQIYWFYKNWAAVKKATGIKGMYPFWRAFFTVLFCWSLFKRIRHDAGAYGYKHQRLAYIAAFIFISSRVGLSILGILANISSLPPLQLLIFLLWLLIFLPLETMALLIMQRAIKFHNEHAIPDYPKKRRLTKGEVVWIILGCLWWGVSVLYAVLQR
jgi:hypothetical protein